MIQIQSVATSQLADEINGWLIVTHKIWILNLESHLRGSIITFCEYSIL